MIMGAPTKSFLRCLAVLSVMATAVLSHPSYSTAQFREPFQRRCSPTKYHCGRDVCIPGNRRCDGHVDCHSGDDESNCVCGDGEFQCLNDKCLVGSRRCDGQYDCQNGEDELHCGCASDKFRCVTDGWCVLSSWVCDGFPDCEDCSDEHECSNSQVDCSKDPGSQIRQSAAIESFFKIFKQYWQES